MKRFVVSVFLLLIVFIAMNKGIVTVNMGILHSYVWIVLQWVAGVLGGAIISSTLNKPQKRRL